MFGLDPDTISNIKEAFSQLPEIEKVILYGSRAKGDHKNGSDIDITLLGKNISLESIYKLDEELYQLYLPYTFDISIFTQIDNDDLIEHILSVGKTFYTRNNSKFPKGWEEKKLGDVLSIERGGSPRPIKKYLTNSADGINWIKISDATASDKYIYVTKEKITKEGLHKTRVVNEGDFILSNSMSFGRPYIMKTTGCIHDGWLVLKQNGEKIFETEFLYYLLSSPFVFQQFNSKAAGSTVRNLNIALVSSVNVPLPPLPDQKRIVAILDKAFAAIAKAKANAEQNLKNAKDLFESYLQRVFENKGEGWIEKEFGDVITTLTDYHANGSYKILKNNVELKDSDDYAWMVRSTDFENNFQNNFKYIDKHGYDFLNKSKIFGNEIIMSKIGNAGNVYLMPKIDRPCSLAMNLFLIRMDEKKVMPAYIFQYLKTNSGEAQIKTRLKGATTKTITKDNVRSIIIPIPSLKIQETIINKMVAISIETKKLETIYQQKTDDLEELKKSVLQKAFNGELTENEIAL